MISSLNPALRNTWRFAFFISIFLYSVHAVSIPFMPSKEQNSEQPARKLSKREATASGITLQQTLHQAAALGAMTLLMTAHRGVMNTGFHFSRSVPCTDTVIVGIVGLVTVMWTALVIVSGVFVEDKPCIHGVEQCLARLAYAPWLLQILFVFWLVGIWDIAIFAEKRRESNETIGFWKLDSSRGPFDWSSSVTGVYRWAIYITMGCVVGVTTYGAISNGLYTVGLLNCVGVVLFVVDAGGTNRYILAPHRYRADMLRIILPTSHSEGTVYILPSKGYGFDAVWSPKITSEHIEADSKIMHMFELGRAGELQPSEPRVRLRETMVTFLRNTTLSTSEIEQLAAWLYLDSTADPAMSKIRCTRAPGLHLIGRDLMYALAHAEYIVFMSSGALQPRYKDNLSMLRNVKKSGGANMGSKNTIGFEGGLNGYKAAVRYIYSLFNEPIDDSALNPNATPPSYSMALGSSPSDIEQYVEQLWDLSIGHSESTFGALYMFTAIWFLEVGNDGGFHPFPLRTKTRQGDFVAWHIVWRQAWYGCIVSQLATMSPIILSAFLSGVLQ